MSAHPELSSLSAAAKFSTRRDWAAEQAIGFLMQQAVENRDVVSLAAGLVDQESLPVEETRAALDIMLRDDQRARSVLQYGTTAGSMYLREQLVQHLARLEDCPPADLGVDENQLIVTTGSQQLLSLVSEVLLDPGDICLVAAPTYFAYLGTLNGVGARIIPVTADGDGMCPDALADALDRIEQAGELDRVKLIYVVSYYENPSGVSLSHDRRRDIVQLARSRSAGHRIYIIDDAAYRELRYDGPSLPSVWSFDEDREHVILIQTFSKSFSPGLRVGFGVVPQELVTPICDRKGNEDFGSANFNQNLIATVLDEGLYIPHVEQLCNSYRKKRDGMLTAADQHFSDIAGVDWVHPHGGLYVWMTLPTSIDTGFNSSLFRRAVQDEQVMYVPGELCYAGSPAQRERNHMRLSFGVQTLDGINEGMQRLSRAVRAEIAAADQPDGSK